MSSELTDNDLNFTADGNINASGNITITNSTATTYTWPTVDGTANQVLSAGAVPGTMEWITQTAGVPGGPPGGITGSIQYNNLGSFAGTSEFLWDTTNNRILIAPSSLVDASALPVPIPQYFSVDIRNDFNATASSVLSLLGGTTGGCAIILSDSVSIANGQILYDNNLDQMGIASSSVLAISASTDLTIDGDTVNINSGTATNILSNGDLTITSSGTITIETDNTITPNNDITITTSDGNNTIGYTGASGSFQIQTNSLTYTWPTTGPSAGQVLQSDASGNMSWVNQNVGLAPAGSQGSIQFYDSGSFGGDSNFLYDTSVVASQRMLVASPGSTTAAIYADTVQFTLDLRNDDAAGDRCVINIQGGSATNESGIRFSEGGTPTDTYIRYDVATNFPNDTLIINTQGQLEINSTQDTNINSGANDTIITCGGDFDITATNDITIQTTAGLLRLAGNNITEIRGQPVNLVSSGNTYSFGSATVADGGILHLNETAPNEYDVLATALFNITPISTNPRLLVSGSRIPDVTSGITTIDIASNSTAGNSTQLRLFAETASTDSGILFIDDFTDPYSPEAIINYNHSADTFNVSVPQNGNSMNFTLTNGSEINMSAPNGDIVLQNVAHTMTLPNNTVLLATVGAFMRIDEATSTIANINLEWSSVGYPFFIERSLTLGPFTYSGFEIEADDVVLYLQAVPPGANDDSSVVIAMESASGDVLEIQYIRDTLNFEHRLTYNIPVFSNPDVVMEELKTDVNNTVTWTYDEVLLMDIDRSGANDVYNWTFGPTGDPVMTISRDTGTALTAFTMDIDNTGVGDTVVYSGGSIIRDTSLSKYKSNQRPLDFDPRDIYKLEGRSFEWNTRANMGVTDFGYIAEEVEGVNPMFVKYNGKSGEMSGVKYSQLVVPIIEELKRINGLLDELESQINKK